MGSLWAGVFDKARTVPKLPLAIGIAVTLLFVFAVAFGRIGMERILVALSLPCGACWLAFCGCMFLGVRGRRRKAAWSLVATWIFYTLTGNGLIANWVLRKLELPYCDSIPQRFEALDLLVVLGGGARVLENGTSQVTNAGDRVVLAARIFRRGKAKCLVATGVSNAFSEDGGQAMGGATSQIWQDLGVPGDKIVRIGGRNTSEEVRLLKRLVADRPDQRVGLLTSAWHMRRAVRLAERENLKVIPVPADFQASGPPSSLFELVVGIIPSADGFWKSQIVAKELLACAVGR